MHTSPRFGAFVVMALAGCLPSEAARTCADGLVCATNQVCAPLGGSCVDEIQVAACADLGDAAACLLPGVGLGTCVARVCRVTGCGDGVVDVGEACDDGNDRDDDACTSTCALPTCGDGARQGEEACDDGAANGDDRACTSRCLVAACGDNLVEAGVEECDAGPANADTDACTTSCRRAACGDGLVFAGAEVCDDGNLTAGDGCRADCAKVELCGDALVDAGEACDDGNGNAVDGCDACVATEWLASSLLRGVIAGTEVRLGGPGAVAVDGLGNVYVAESTAHRVRRIAVGTGAITTVAGTGLSGFGGDGGLATSAQLSTPLGVAVDGLGNLYIADSYNQRIRRVEAATGVITTVAGTGAYASGGDGGPATSADLARPRGVAVDGLGNLYIADTENNRIRVVATGTGVITTRCGDGFIGDTGDGGPAAAARLQYPSGVAVDGAGNLYIADTSNHRIRRISAVDQQISTVVGVGIAGPAGDGGLASAAELAYPPGVAVDGQGNLYIADRMNHRVRRVSAVDQRIETIIGDGTEGMSGDGGPATAAELAQPAGVAVDVAGNVYVADTGNQRVRRRAAATGDLDTVAGTSAAVADSGVATGVLLARPSSVALDGAGNVYIADTDNHRIRRVDAATGILETIAGTGAEGFAGDLGPAIDAKLAGPSSLALDADGNLYVADRLNHRVRRIEAATGIITTVAGTGIAGPGPNDVLATASDLNLPDGVAVGADGHLYVADSYNYRVRRIDATTGVITTFAGTGTYGYNGDDIPATTARLATPSALAFDAAGNLFVTEFNRVRRITAAGTITTVAGIAAFGFAGDGGLATAARLGGPRGVAVDAAGNVFISDAFNNRVRRVAAVGGIITTIVGSTSGFRGDGGAGVDAQLASPQAVAVDGQGRLFIADANNGVVRRLDAGGTLTTIAGQVHPEGMGPLAQARLAQPEALAIAAPFTLVAGGASGTVQALRPDRLEVVVGRYRHSAATAQLARVRGSAFGAVGGVAYDPAAGAIYVAETSAHRLHVVTVVDPADAMTWTISPLVNSAGVAGAADGPAATAGLRGPRGLFFDDDARILYVADAGNHTIRAVDVDAGTVATVAGTPETLGYFGDGLAADVALLFAPTAITRCVASGDMFIADSGNHRVRRVAAGTGTISTVLGDGVAAASGQGRPSATFPVNDPRGLACDASGNLYVTSTTAVRLLPAEIAQGEATGIVDGTGPVQTIYGAPPRSEVPASLTSCLTGLGVVDEATVHVADSCTGILVELWRQPLASP